MKPLHKTTALGILGTAFLLVVFASVRNTGSDPRATLLVSESLLTRQSIKLDHYGADLPNRYGYVIHQKRGHYYNYLPIGTALASIPFVAVANGLGFDMSTHEPAVQVAIAGVTSVLTLLLLIKLALLFVGPLNALVVASVFWFGTSLASTCGTALWSHNFATLFALLAIYAAIIATKGNRPRIWPLLSFSLFAAYLCRPTMALLAPFALLYLFTYHRLAAVKAGLFLLALLSAFVGFSMQEFGQMLPDYYNPKRLEGASFHQAFYGNLFSPARGLLIYSPFILVVWGCFKYAKKDWGLKPSWLLVGLVWPVLHLVFISRFPHWWAGHSYGARFMTDILPGLFLLTLFSWPTTTKGVGAKTATGIVALASIFAIGIHSGQGLFNKHTAAWNYQPNIDTYPEYLFDWRYPQFFANQRGHEARMVRHARRQPPAAILPGEEITFASDRVVFLGWWDPGATYRWTSGTTSTIFFMGDELIASIKGELDLEAGSLGRQRVIITLNGKQIFSQELNSWEVSRAIHFSPALITSGENSLVFQLPDARQPGNGDPRVLALALKAFRIQ